MTTVALCSGKGSPGVSTLACVFGAAWPRRRRVVVAECDPSGNDLAARFGLSQLVGMTSLVVEARRREASTALDAHLQQLPGGLETLVGPVSPDAASSLDRELRAVVGPVLSQPVDLLVDCGRLLRSAMGQAAAVTSSDHVVVVMRADAASVPHAHWALETVRGMAPGARRWLVSVGADPFARGEIERLLGCPLLGSVPDDRAGAAMACGVPGGHRSFARSPLVAAARRVVRCLDSDRLTAPRDPESPAVPPVAGGHDPAEASHGAGSPADAKPSEVR